MARAAEGRAGRSVAGAPGQAGIATDGRDATRAAAGLPSGDRRCFLSMPPTPPYAVSAATTPSSRSIACRIRNFCIFPVTVIGNSSTNRT